ncbi:DUF2794 domain-containing protein [Fodinicurvata halophila]|uniref:DUF2794 domain-containing protein n=1 Tax=Fodinicurvata halophila TaxID=1419723 RepID=A0ABV8UM57_9PROT
MAKVVRLEDIRIDRKQRATPLYFNRTELDALLSLYSHQVADGEWRDYAIDHKPGMAMFSVFRHSFDRPLFTIAKRMQTTGNVPEYMLFDTQKMLARKGRLTDLLDYFRKKLEVV